MTIHNKAADKGFKIYCLYHANYLFIFMYTLKAFKIVKLQSTKNLILFVFMILQIIKLLSQFYEYVIYLNNFFNFIKLFITLKTLNINVVETAKQNFKFNEDLLKLKAASIKKKN